MGPKAEEQVSDEELDRRDCLEHPCDYPACDQEGPPTVITAIWSYYHRPCYEKRQKEIWG